jgi:hypothetical protein
MLAGFGAARKRSRAIWHSFVQLRGIVWSRDLILVLAVTHC